jgi:Pyruvate/2-oxoacid:ferredoxin oxidoreductase delta subunit
MLATSGYTAVVDQSRCVACRTCEKYCQFEAIAYIDGRKSVNYERCFGCGVCVQKCPQQAIALTRDPMRGIPLELDVLMSEATAAVH